MSLFSMKLYTELSRPNKIKHYRLNTVSKDKVQEGDAKRTIQYNGIPENTKHVSFSSMTTEISSHQCDHCFRHDSSCATQTNTTNYEKSNLDEQDELNFESSSNSDDDTRFYATC